MCEIQLYLFEKSFLVGFLSLLEHNRREIDVLFETSTPYLQMYYMTKQCRTNETQGRLSQIFVALLETHSPNLHRTTVILKLMLYEQRFSVFISFSHSYLFFTWWDCNHSTHILIVLHLKIMIVVQKKTQGMWLQIGSCSLSVLNLTVLELVKSCSFYTILITHSCVPFPSSQDEIQNWTSIGRRRTTWWFIYTPSHVHFCA